DGADDDLLPVVGDVEAGDAHPRQRPHAACIPARGPGLLSGKPRAADTHHQASHEVQSHAPILSPNCVDLSWGAVDERPRADDTPGTAGGLLNVKRRFDRQQASVLRPTHEQPSDQARELAPLAQPIASREPFVLGHRPCGKLSLDYAEAVTFPLMGIDWLP